MDKKKRIQGRNVSPLMEVCTVNRDKELTRAKMLENLEWNCQSILSTSSRQRVNTLYDIRIKRDCFPGQTFLIKAKFGNFTSGYLTVLLYLYYNNSNYSNVRTIRQVLFFYRNPLKIHSNGIIFLAENFKLTKLKLIRDRLNSRNYSTWVYFWRSYRLQRSTCTVWQNYFRLTGRKFSTTRRVKRQDQCRG